MRTSTWHVEVYISEQDEATHARAVLHGSSSSHPEGIGTARRAPGDADVPEIGDEVAVARALHSLGHELLSLAGADISDLEHDDVHLRMSMT